MWGEIRDISFQVTQILTTLRSLRASPSRRAFAGMRAPRGLNILKLVTSATGVWQRRGT